LVHREIKHFSFGVDEFCNWLVGGTLDNAPRGESVADIIHGRSHDSSALLERNSVSCYENKSKSRGYYRIRKWALCTTSGPSDYRAEESNNLKGKVEVERQLVGFFGLWIVVKSRGYEGGGECNETWRETRG
jgi:hypothetical protein